MSSFDYSLFEWKDVYIAERMVYFHEDNAQTERLPLG